MTAFAAFVFSLAATIAIAFQLALALGAPWGAYANGGRFPGRLPPAMRAVAVVQAALIAGMAGLVLSAAGLALPQWSDAPAWLLWAVVGFSSLSIIANAITPSIGERRIWLPVAIVMFASSLTVALTAG